MHCTLPPVAGIADKAGGPGGCKRPGGQPLPRRHAGDGDGGREKYSSLELDSTVAVGVGNFISKGHEAELSNESGVGPCPTRFLALVFICVVSLLIIFIINYNWLKNVKYKKICLYHNYVN